MESVPPPFIPRPTWFDDAACSGLDVNLFFPEPGTTVQTAIAVCETCPVSAECHEYAVAGGDRHGVWGGVAARDRRRLTSQARHGSVACYNNGCRCHQCVDAAATYRTRYRSLRVLEGGAA